MSDPIRNAQARAAEFNAQARAAEFNAQAPTQRANTPEAIALRELMEAVEEYRACPYWDNDMAGARLTLALNAARNALKAGT